MVKPPRVWCIEYRVLSIGETPKCFVFFLSVFCNFVFIHYTQYSIHNTFFELTNYLLVVLQEKREQIKIEKIGDGHAEHDKRTERNLRLHCKLFASGTQ